MTKKWIKKSAERVPAKAEKEVPKDDKAPSVKRFRAKMYGEKQE